RRGRGVLARGPGRPGPGRDRGWRGRGRRGGSASRAPPPPAPAQRRPDGVMAIPVTAAIGLGGNIGDAAATLREALQALDALLRASSLYRTPAWGNTEQDDFTNAVALLQTELDARALLDALLEVELRFGRDRAASPPWGPRTLDLDLLLYGDAVIDEPGLRVPHPHLHERAFVLVPLAQVAPGLRVPGHGPVSTSLDEIGSAASRES